MDFIIYQSSIIRTDRLSPKEEAMQFPSSDALNRLPSQFFKELVQTLKKFEAKGIDIINLGQGNPDLKTPDHIIDALNTANKNPIHHKYSPFRGYDTLKNAVATYYAREYGVELNPETEIAILPGTKTGLVELSQCLLNEDDVALVPDPGYPDYLSGIALQGARPVLMLLKESNDFLPDLDKILKNDQEDAKLMFLNYPNNPTSGVATPAFFDEVIAFCKKNKIALCHDFAYHTIQFEEKRAISLMQQPGAKDVGIELFTLSKAYNMAGFRVGFAVGNKDLISKLEEIQDHLFVSLSGGIQIAAEAALLSSQAEAEKLTATYERRRNTLINGLRAIGWEVDAPKGTFFCWLKIPRGFTSMSFSQFLLEHAHVFVAPGSGFGPSGEGYVRVALLADCERLLEACERIQSTRVFNQDKSIL